MSKARKGKHVGFHVSEETKKKLHDMFVGTNKTKRKSPITDEERQRMSDKFKEIAKQ